MGCSPSFPLVYQPIAYEPQDRFSDTGQYKGPAVEREVNAQLSFFHVLHTHFWETFIQERQRRLKAKEKFLSADVTELKQMFPLWSEEEISDLKLRFQMLDLNSDGLLDEREIDSLLDDLGDTSSPEERRKYFVECDSDGSDGIDFIEFLQVIYHYHQNDVDEGEKSKIDRLFTRGIEEQARKIQRLSVKQQIEAGVF
ncbi:uncharacterized protein [Oscarella lobularis]|uniref:uncharacterized protein n=1 Tax=Oscarella lobularis TaxID=121494 RepID=UPI00331437AD